MYTMALRRSSDSNDSVCIGAVNDHSSVTLPDVEALLIIEVDGFLDRCEIDAGLIKGLLIEHGAADVKLAKEKNEIKGKKEPDYLFGGYCYSHTDS